ncbi:twin-arginine translocase TatA/TatE family subunit [Microbacterium sp. NPDC057650]|uniref:twin-arginine translocase TatA/TatE family subunit n=1 Tax=unclassified Microbacterium TaxID=2609290 RepID=UPI00366EEBEA
MDFGLTFEKLLLIGVVAVLIVGPERLPALAEKFAKFVRQAGEYIRDTKGKMRDEMGPEIDDIDWRKLDPRQYDPRRIIREALLDEPTPAAPAAAAATAVAATATAATASASTLTRAHFDSKTPPPFDDEAT